MALPGANPIPDKLVNAKIYYEGDEMVGTGTVDLPELSYMKEEMGGLGIAGTLETPVIGHFESLTLTINWNTVTKDGIKLLQAKKHQINVYGSVQYYDAASGELVPKQAKLTADCLPKKTGIGKAEKGKKMDSGTELECLNIKLTVEGEEVLDYGKLNFKCIIDGVDQLAEVKGHLGG